jgi:hypothetical protein
MPDPQSERSVTLREVIPQPQDRLLYEYDFGDGWEHEILVEELLAPEEGVRYLVCVEGEYAARPEDCGGIPGYYMMLEAIEDEENPDHEEMLEWIGGDFNPVTVDLDGINRRLELLRKNAGEIDRDSGLQPYCNATDSVPECSERNSIAGATAMPEVTRP